MQHDITHCNNEKCPTKEHCYRWHAHLEAEKMELPRRSYAIIDEDYMADGMCLLFWEYKKRE
jgi:hypothetical protein